MRHCSLPESERMSPTSRKVWLTTHVVCSVGWLGAVATSLALAVVAAAADSATTSRSAYITLEAVGWWVVVPLSVASLLTGTLQSLITSWGLVRHYWIIAKLLINVVSIVILLLYMQTLGHLADQARAFTETGSDPSPIVHAGVALGLLVIATLLSVLKPRGLTKRGARFVARSS
jgi:hypothetical protein